jgi:hypothetical protein
LNREVEIGKTGAEKTASAQNLNCSTGHELGQACLWELRMPKQAFGLQDLLRAMEA